MRIVLAVLPGSYLTKLTSAWMGIAHLNPIHAAVAGGILIGLGLLILFRHRTSLGGIDLLALYAQDQSSTP